MNEEKALDEEGYPTEAALERVRAWPWTDCLGLMAFVRSIWWAADWGWSETHDGCATEYSISTGGWSGNESLIDALQENRQFWMLCWVSSRRGGHYEFIVRPIVSVLPAAGAPETPVAAGEKVAEPSVSGTPHAK